MGYGVEQIRYRSGTGPVRTGGNRGAEGGAAAVQIRYRSGTGLVRTGGNRGAGGQQLLYSSGTAPLTLFDAKTLRQEANPKAHVCEHLQRESKGCDFLVLWLDCDREGENICFEVMDNVVDRLRPGSGQRVFRARFSAITAPEIKAAMVMDNKVDRHRPGSGQGVFRACFSAITAPEIKAVMVGVAFTRFQTRYFQGKYGNLDASVVSYGPCQTPTLNFTVERHQAIAGDRLDLEWERGRIFDQDVAGMYCQIVKDAKKMIVTDVSVKDEKKQRPSGLNTVELLKVASSMLNIGPAHTMQVAERLYTSVMSSMLNIGPAHTMQVAERLYTSHWASPHDAGGGEAAHLDELLKAASSMLNIGPAHTMQEAERLYTSGYPSYPRTESSAYPPNFDLDDTLKAMTRHPVWGYPSYPRTESSAYPPNFDLDDTLKAMTKTSRDTPLYPRTRIHRAYPPNFDLDDTLKAMTQTPGYLSYPRTESSAYPPNFDLDSTLKSMTRHSGYLSYPRTESSAYPPNFDLDGTLRAMTRHPVWGAYASGLASQGLSKPQGGKDVGDHPPITPVRSATEDELGGGDMWRIYVYVARHFLGSVSPDAVYRKTKVSFNAGGETFFAHGSVNVKPGFTAIMPWKASQNEPLPPLQQGEQLEMKEVELYQGKTSPPDYLTEAELIGLMEKHGIGTDASIPTHVNNVVERNYVSIQAGRKVVPTELGITLIKGYQLIDPELCKPQVRAHVEDQLNLIAAGKADKASVVIHTLDQFRAKFLFFVERIQRMDALFEASFSPLSSSGKPLSICGKCKQASEQELTCPMDDFEIVLFSLSGPDGKTYPLCPFCYNHPPFENITKVGVEGASGSRAGMPCSTCPHPSCAHSLANNGVVPCPECEHNGATLVLDPVSAPKWRLDCNRCNFMIYLPPNLYKAEVSKDTCEDCGSKILDLDWKKGSAPAAVAAETSYSGCVALVGPPHDVRPPHDKEGVAEGVDDVDVDEEEEARQHHSLRVMKARIWRKYGRNEECRTACVRLRKSVCSEAERPFLERLDLNTLKRYKKVYRLSCPEETKEKLLLVIARHFNSQTVDSEPKVLTRFVESVRRRSQQQAQVQAQHMHGGIGQQNVAASVQR
eukprot:gene24302-9904_t